MLYSSCILVGLPVIMGFFRKKQCHLKQTTQTCLDHFYNWLSMQIALLRIQNAHLLSLYTYKKIQRTPLVK